MKPCSTCHEVKPLSEFNVMRRSKDGHQARCRVCCQAWYARNSAEQKRRVAIRNRHVIGQSRVWLADYLQRHPCVDCGEDDLRCLEFDHRPGSGKVKDVTTLLRQSASLEKIQREIEKCDVRCANCHRRRTAERGGFWRQGAFEDTEQQLRDATTARLANLLAPRT
jgi:hypothetical protein